MCFLGVRGFRSILLGGIVVGYIFELVCFFFGGGPRSFNSLKGVGGVPPKAALIHEHVCVSIVYVPRLANKS